MSEGFSPEWLALREPYDARAVSRELLERFVDWASGRPMLRLLDLGAGTGAHCRRLAPHLGSRQRWTLVELDPALIAAGEPGLPAGAVYRRLDLQRELETLADEPVDAITASALLDLASADWLRRLVALRARLACALYLTLSYDGRIDWRPADPLDGTVLQAVNRHQGTDKGFGPALGPDAAPILAELLGGAQLVASDWWLGPDDRAIQRELLEGYTALLREATAPWRQRRLDHIEAGRSTLTVGHLDLLYL